jgi:hypothetical protein
MKEGLHEGQGVMYYHNGDIYEGNSCQPMSSKQLDGA